MLPPGIPYLASQAKLYITAHREIGLQILFAEHSCLSKLIHDCGMQVAIGDVGITTSLNLK
jgi:hypothetical protein